MDLVHSFFKNERPNLGKGPGKFWTFKFLLEHEPWNSAFLFFLFAILANLLSNFACLIVRLECYKWRMMINRVPSCKVKSNNFWRSITDVCSFEMFSKRWLNVGTKVIHTMMNCEQSLFPLRDSQRPWQPPAAWARALWTPSVSAGHRGPKGHISYVIIII